MSPLQHLQDELTRAHYDNWGTDAEVEIGRRLAEAKRATESTDERCLRLGVMAADKDAEGERHMAAEADAAGRAAGRRLAGNDDALAASFDREAAACRALAADCAAEAERLRSQCAALRRAQAFTPIAILAAE